MWRTSQARAETARAAAAGGLYRLKSLAAELRFRRRRLDVYRKSPSWPGKETALTFELINYDRRLVIAAHMLDVAAPARSDRSPLAPEIRAALEDRLAHAGLNVHGPDPGTGDVFRDNDLII